jgi:predicted protein tyrosine phosphatase
LAALPPPAPNDVSWLPAEEHITDLFNFVREWDRRAPLVATVSGDPTAVRC